MELVKTDISKFLYKRTTTTKDKQVKVSKNARKYSQIKKFLIIPFESNQSFIIESQGIYGIVI